MEQTIIDNLLSLFQFTRPGKGATATRQSIYTDLRCFNSRTLGRVRQLWVLFLKSLAVVSIHAPWEGCDLQDAVILHLMSVSIHAPWEGCDADYLTYAPVKVVSIHAPWEGCDSFRLFISFAHHTFQFTHPGKGATLTTSLKRTAITFQFTHPGKGATYPSSSCCASFSSFNSRTLGRVRLSLSAVSPAFKEFQFTHPGKGATGGDRRPRRLMDRFNSRTLGRVRPSVRGASCVDLSFQFTHPGKGATAVWYTAGDSP